MNNLTSKEEMMRRIEELEQALEEEKRKKAVTRYGLIWEDSPEKLDDPNIVPLLSIDTDEYLTRFIKGNELNKDILMDKEKPMNYLIEGDNYHSLKALERTHTGKIDVIYIDPPYNTGNEFVYNDKLVDKEDGFRHSKWLSFMYKRLRLAKKLLADDGVIFVSIDDNEQAQLKLLMDKVFGEENFVNTFVWTTKNSAMGIPPRNMLVNNHEYIYSYTRNHTKKFAYLGEKRNLKGFSNPDNDPRGLWKRQYLQRFRQGFSEKTIINPKTQFKYTFPTPYTQEKIDNWLKEGRIVFSEDDSSYPVKKEYLSEYKNNTTPTLSYWGEYLTKTATERLKEIFEGEKMFDYVKPLELIKKIIKQSTNHDAIVLDFFAGSGTTGHAVMELNEEDGGNRQFILCTNNEVSEEKVRNHFYEKGLIPKPNKTEFNKFKKENPDQVLDFMKSDEYQELGIARSVTYERLRRVIEGYTTPKGKDVAGIPANLMYLTTKEYTKEDVKRVREEGRFVDTTEMYAGIFYLKYPRTTHTVMFVTDDLSSNMLKKVNKLPTDTIVAVLDKFKKSHKLEGIIREQLKSKNIIFEYLNY